MRERLRRAQRTSGARMLIGGPSATSWPVIGLMMGVLVIDRLGTDLERTGQPVLLLSSALVGSITIAAVLRLSRVTLVRTRSVAVQPRPAVTVLCLLAAASSAAFIGRVHDAAVGLPVDESAVHIAQRTGWALTVLLLLVISTAAMTGHRAEITALTARAATLRRAHAEVNELLSTAVTTELDAVSAEIRAEIMKLDGATFASAIAQLRRVSLRLIRPRSHEVARPRPLYRMTEPAGVPVRPGLGELVADITADRPIRPALPAAMVALWATAFTLADVGPLDALMTGSVLGLLAVLVWGSYGLLVDRVLPGRGSRTRVVVVFTAILAAAISWVAAGEAFEQLSGLSLPTAETPVQRLAQALTLTLFPIMQVLTRALRRRGEFSVAAMRTYNDLLAAEVARANRELWMQRRALARKLHGSIQSTVNAAALRLSSAERNGVSPGDALARARTDIERALVGLEDEIAQGHWHDPDDLDQAIARIRGLWKGVADIEIELTKDVIDPLRTDLAMRAVLMDVLTESCSNAVRHGNATRIRAHVTREEDFMLLEVVDDGSPGAVGLPGLGSALLDETTVHWQRTQTASGTRLSAAFPRP